MFQEASQQMDSPDAPPTQPSSILNEPAEVSERAVTAYMPELTSLERSTHMIDQATLRVYNEILEGYCAVYWQHRELLPEQPPPKIVTIDTGEHRKMIRRFMRQNISAIKRLRDRSVEIQERSRRMEQQDEKQRAESLHLTLEKRREAIERRLKQKADLMNQIRQSVLESNAKFQQVRKKQFLYQQKEEQFRRDYLLPKLEEEKQVLRLKSELLRPMDLSAIQQHQRHYLDKQAEERVNRTLTSRVISHSTYEPPKFIPKSYIIAQAEEAVKRQEEEIHAKEAELNMYRKKQFLRVIEESTREERQKQKEVQIDTKSQHGGKIKQLNREEMKKLGNDYLKQLLLITKRKKKQMKTVSPPKLVRGQLELQMIRSDRVQKMQRIRLKRVDQIAQSKQLHPVSKIERLQHESSRLDEMAGGKDMTSLKDRDEVASMYLSSIYAKIALLQASTRGQH